MAQELRERSEIEEQFKWDLTRIFATDADFETAAAKMPERIAQVAALEGTLKDAASIAAYYQISTDVERELYNLGNYAMLRRSEDLRSADAQKLYGKAMSLMVQAASAAAFAEPEILSLDEATLKEIAEDPAMADYKKLLEVLIIRKPHMLDAGQEKVLAALGEALNAPKDIAENLTDADMKFAPARNKDGEDVEVVGSNYILLQSGTDRTLRENSFRSFYNGYKGHIHALTQAYAGTVKAETAEAALRGYSSSREMVMSRGNIPVQVYDNLLEAVHKYMPVMHRYASLRKKILGLDELHYYDLYAPLAGDLEETYSYEEAKELVLRAVEPLGESYTSVVKKGFAERWIDVYPNQGKRGGAFSAGSYDSSPYIMCNFTGTLDSVSTIAHEMGHSMHTWFSNHTQPPQYADYTLFVAEVASTVNENLLIERLLAEETDDRRRLALLNEYLEGFKGTVFRQTMFAEFERKAHEAAEAGETLTPDLLNEIYLQLIRDYFGEDMVVDDEVKYEWSRIPHFHRPFYVYVYATGYSTAVALSEGILSEGAPAVKRYLEFLSMGGSQFPLDELRHAGVDLDTPEPIERALEKFRRVLDDAEATYARLTAQNG